MKVDTQSQTEIINDVLENDFNSLRARIKDPIINIGNCLPVDLYEEAFECSLTNTKELIGVDIDQFTDINEEDLGLSFLLLGYINHKDKQGKQFVEVIKQGKEIKEELERTRMSEALRVEYDREEVELDKKIKQLIKEKGKLKKEIKRIGN